MKFSFRLTIPFVRMSWFILLVVFSPKLVLGIQLQHQIVGPAARPLQHQIVARPRQIDVNRSPPTSAGSERLSSLFSTLRRKLNFQLVGSQVARCARGVPRSSFVSSARCSARGVVQTNLESPVDVSTSPELRLNAVPVLSQRKLADAIRASDPGLLRAALSSSPPEVPSQQTLLANFLNSPLVDVVYGSRLQNSCAQPMTPLQLAVWVCALRRRAVESRSVVQGQSGRGTSALVVEQALRSSRAPLQGLEDLALAADAGTPRRTQETIHASDAGTVWKGISQVEGMNSQIAHVKGGGGAGGGEGGGGEGGGGAGGGGGEQLGNSNFGIQLWILPYKPAGTTPGEEVLLRASSLSVLRLLLESGAAPDDYDRVSQALTPLTLAVSARDVGVVTLLLEFGADALRDRVVAEEGAATGDESSWWRAGRTGATATNFVSFPV